MSPVKINRENYENNQQDALYRLIYYSREEQEPLALDTEQEPLALDTEKEPLALDTEKEPLALDTEQEPLALDTEKEPLALDTEQEPLALDTEQEPLALNTEPQSQTGRSSRFNLSNHMNIPLHKNSQQLCDFKLLTVHYSASSGNRSVLHPFVIASVNIKFTTVLEDHHFVSQISLDHDYVTVYASNIHIKLQPV
jgi:hypothetical protein